MNWLLSTLRAAGWAIALLLRASLVGMLIATAILAGLVAWHGARPVGAVGAGGKTAGLDETSYWEFMAASYQAYVVRLHPAHRPDWPARLPGHRRNARPRQGRHGSQRDRRAQLI